MLDHTAVSLLVQKTHCGRSNGGRDNIRMQGHFNYTYHNSMFYSVVNCLGSCLEIRIQSGKLESIKAVLFRTDREVEFAKRFPSNLAL